MWGITFPSISREETPGYPAPDIAERLQDLERNYQARCTAVCVRNDETFFVTYHIDGFGIHLGNEQRHFRIHPVAGGI